MIKGNTLLNAYGRIATTFNRHLSQGAVLTVCIQFGGAIVTFTMYLLAARVLSSLDFGRLAMWLSVCQMACVVALLGQEMFVLRSLNEYAVAGRPDLAKGSLLFSIAIVGIVPLLLALTIGTVGVLALGETPRLMVATGLYMVAFSAIALFSHIGRSTVGILLAEGMRDLFWRSLIVAVLAIFIACKVLIQIDQYFLLSAAGMGLTLVIQAMAIFRQIPRSVLQAKATWQIGRWLRASSGFWASSILETINQFFDVVIIYWFLDPVTAGAYFVASRLANMFVVPLAALHNFATRRIPGLFFSGKTQELNQTLRLMAEVMLLCVVVGIGLLVFEAGPVLGVFGSQFTAQKDTLIILAIGTAFYAAGGPVSSVLMIAGYQARYPWIVAANIGLRFLGFALLIPSFGLKGAALAAAGSLAVITIALNVLCRLWLGLDPSLLTLIRRPSLRLFPGTSTTPL